VAEKHFRGPPQRRFALLPHETFPVADKRFTTFKCTEICWPIFGTTPPSG